MEKIETIEVILDEFCRRNLDFDQTVGILRVRQWLIAGIAFLLGLVIGHAV